MLGPLRQLARRVRDRLDGPVVGERFPANGAAAFAALDASAEGVFSSVGAAVVSSWEVLLADVGRALPPDQRAKAVARISDALVPTLSPLQHLDRPFREQNSAGVKVALRSGRLVDATDPLATWFEGLGAPVAAGWAKTVGYLGPICELFEEPEALRGSLAFTGSALRGVFDEQARVFAEAMAALPTAPSLEPALMSALDGWKTRVVRGVEMTIYGARTKLVEAAAAQTALQ